MCLSEGCPWLSTLPPPTACHWGVRPATAALFLWARGVRAWEPVTIPPAHALASWLVRCGGDRRWPGGGGALCGSVRGVWGRALSLPRLLVLGARSRSPLSFSLGTRSAGVGGCNQPHSACACELALCAVGAPEESLGGGDSCLYAGCPGFGSLPTLTASPWGVRQASTTYSLCVQCAGVEPRTPPCARGPPGSALRGGGRGCVRGGVPRRAGCSVAPSPLPWFNAWCARFSGLRHLVAVVACHLSGCLGTGRRGASLACLVAPCWCAAPCPVQSLSVLQSPFLLPWCLPDRGSSPRIFFAAERGTSRRKTALMTPAAGPCHGGGA